MEGKGGVKGRKLQRMLCRNNINEITSSIMNFHLLCMFYFFLQYLSTACLFSMALLFLYSRNHKWIKTIQSPDLLLNDLHNDTMKINFSTSTGYHHQDDFFFEQYMWNQHLLIGSLAFAPFKIIKIANCLNEWTWNQLFLLGTALEFKYKEKFLRRENGDNYKRDMLYTVFLFQYLFLLHHVSNRNCPEFSTVFSSEEPLA